MAAASPASEEPRPGVALVAAAALRPHPEKLAKGGEDAVTLALGDRGGVLALADGVSGCGSSAPPLTPF